MSEGEFRCNPLIARPLEREYINNSSRFNYED